MESDVAVVEGFEALDAFNAVAWPEVGCCNCFDTVQSSCEVRLAFFGNALFNETEAAGGDDQIGQIVICNLVFVFVEVISLISVFLVEFRCGLSCRDAVFLGVQADIALAFVEGNVVVKGIAFVGSFFCFFADFFDLCFDCRSFFLSLSDLFCKSRELFGDLL